MNDKFDELAKGLAQSVTRRGALKKFGAGLAGAVLASLGLANKAEAGGQAGCNRCRHLCAKLYGYGTDAYFICAAQCPCPSGGL